MAELAGIVAALGLLAMLVALSTRTDPSVAALVTSIDEGAKRGRSIPRGLARVAAIRRLARVEAIESRIRASGWNLDVDDVIVLKVAAGFGVAVLFLVLSPSMVPVGLVAGFGAFFGPDFVLARAARARARRADAELPMFLDLLAAASSAGLAAPAAITRATGGLRGPLADELAGAGASVEVGGRWRDELAAMASRLELPDLDAAVTALSRTESLGSSLAESMHELADDVREARRSRAAERARKAPVKMLFPLVFMLLPAFLLLTVVPVLIATLRSLK
jgi:tight adherence protein C